MYKILIRIESILGIFNKYNSRNLKIIRVHYLESLIKIN